MHRRKMLLQQQRQQMRRDIDRNKRVIAELQQQLQDQVRGKFRKYDYGYNLGMLLEIQNKKVCLLEVRKY